MICSNCPYYTVLIEEEGEKMNYNAMLIDALLWGEVKLCDGSIIADGQALTPRLTEELISLAKIGADLIAKKNDWRH